MAHFAEINENNIVLRVVVTDNNDPNGDEGYQWLIDNLGGRWIKASYNNKIRKVFPSPGFRYDEEKDAFIPIKLFNSWIFNEEVWEWEPPVPRPESTDSIYYEWDEASISWKPIMIDQQ